MCWLTKLFGAFERSSPQDIVTRDGIGVAASLVTINLDKLNEIEWLSTGVIY